MIGWIDSKHNFPSFHKQAERTDCKKHLIPLLNTLIYAVIQVRERMVTLIANISEQTNQMKSTVLDIGSFIWLKMSWRGV